MSYTHFASSYFENCIVASLAAVQSPDDTANDNKRSIKVGNSSGSRNMSESKDQAKKKKPSSNSEKNPNKTHTGDGDSSESSSESVQEDTEDYEASRQIGKGVAHAAITIDRDEYLTAHRELSFDRGQLQMKNNILHRRLAEYYKKRKQEHVLKPLEGAMDLEEKYQQKLFAYEELKDKEEREMADIKTKVQAVEVTYRNKLENAENKFDALQNHEKTTATGLIYAKKGKPISDKTVQRFLTLQRRKQEQATALCLRYIRARNAVNDLESIVRRLEKLGPVLYVAHYEQLCIDNRNYMTKIEEREDELIKNRTKCTEHNQILAHIREKMNHTDEVIAFTECDFGDAEMEFQRVRESLGDVKMQRNKMRWSLELEQLKAGLLTRKDLLRDFQNANELVLKLIEKKELLERQIASTSRELREARRCMKLHNNTAGEFGT